MSEKVLPEIKNADVTIQNVDEEGDEESINLLGEEEGKIPASLQAKYDKLAALSSSSSFIVDGKRKKADRKSHKNYFLRLHKDISDQLAVFSDKNINDSNFDSSSTPCFTLARSNVVNQLLIKMENDIVNFPEAVSIFEKIDRKLQKIKNQTFRWEMDYKKLSYLREVFSIATIFNKPAHFLFVNGEILKRIFPVNTFTAFFENPYYSYNEDDKIYSEVAELFSIMIEAFTKVHLNFNLASQLRLDSRELNLLDPFARQRLRKTNKDFFITQFVDVPNFSLSDLLQKLMEKFVFAGMPRWDQKSGRPILALFLELLSESFDYGLFVAEECDQILSQLYMICEIITSLEEQMEKNYAQQNNSLEQGKPKHRQEFLDCRIAVSKILIHMICLYCDFDFADSIDQMCVNPKAKNILRYFLLDKKTAYTNISLIILKYLTHKVHINDDESGNLNQNISIIFNYFGDYQNDFFTQSIALLKEDYMDHYMSIEKYVLTSKASQIRSSFDQFLAFLRAGGSLQQAAQICESLTSIIVDLDSQLEQEESEKGTNFGLKLELNTYNLPGLLLKIIDFLDSSESIFNVVVTRALKTLGVLLRRNYPAQSVLFNAETHENYKALFLRRWLITMHMLQKVFEEDYFVFNLSNRVFFTTIKIYRLLIMSFKNVVDGDQIKDLQSRDLFATLIFFNKFFDSILDTNLLKVKNKKRYDIIIANETVDLLKDYAFPALTNPNFLDDYSQVNFVSREMFEGKDYAYIKHHFAQKDVKTLLVETYFSFIKLFNKSTFHVYSGRIYAAAGELSEQAAFDQLNVQFKCAILLRLEMVKLFDRFHVFFSNHLLSDRLKFNFKEGLYYGERFIPGNTDDLFPRIKSEIYWLDEFLKYPENTESEDAKKRIGRYLLKGLLPLMFKYFKGILSHVSIMEDKEKIASLKSNCKELVGELMTRQGLFTKYIQVMAPMAIRMLAEFKTFEQAADSGEPDVASSVKRKTRGSIMLKNSNLLLNKAISKDDPNNPAAADQEFESDVYEERVNPDLKKLRETLNKGLCALELMFSEHKEFSYITERYVRSNDFQTLNEYMYMNMRSVSSLKQQFVKAFTQMQTDEQFASRSILSTIRKRYREKKSYYNSHPDENKFVNLLNDDMISNQYNRAVAEFFISEIIKMDPNLDSNDYEHCFYINNSYMQYIVTINNLMNWTSGIRQEIFNILSEDAYTKENSERKYLGDIVSPFIKNLWDIYLSLLTFIYFKTFMDQEWDEYWGKFFLVSNFLQNVCEGNFVRFKKMLRISGLGRIGAINPNYADVDRSIFFECYMVMEVLTMNSNAWLNTDRTIVPSDKAELFPIIRRVMQNVTEMLTGPCLANQLQIYYYRMDIWSGLIKRVVDDVDSKFYELKLSTLVYISAMLEGLDDKIVHFMASNFEVQQLYDLIIELTKRLHSKYASVHRSILASKKSKSKVSNTKQNAITFGQFKIESGDNLTTIASPSDILQMYNTYPDFSEHAVMNIITITFVMMKNMATKIKFYEIFLAGKEKLAQSYESEYKDREEAITFNFIKQVISEVEVLASENGKEKLQRFFFKIPPRCFFLTNEMIMNFHSDCPIDSSSAKRTFLFNRIEAFSIEMEENKTKFSRFGKFSYFLNNDAFKVYQMFLICMSLFLNIVMLVYLRNDDQDDLKSYKSSGLGFILALAIVIAVCSLLLLGFWVWTKYSMEVRVAIAKHRALSADELTKKEVFNIMFFECLIVHPRFGSYFLHFVFTILGIFVNRVFFTLNLLLVTNLSKQVGYILRSIIDHYDKLLVTFFLTILVILSYSFIMLTSFSGEIKDDYTGSSMCDNFISCFINSINVGLRAGGGLGDAMSSFASPSRGGVFWGRFFFDVTFFIIVRLILLNVIAGIIIDTFSDLRDEYTARIHQERNCCFVCGLERWELEKDNIDFDEHIQVSHFVWNYLFFLVHLSIGDYTNFSGVEFDVWTKYKNNDASWMPIDVYLRKGENFRYLDAHEKDQEKEEVGDYE